MSVNYISDNSGETIAIQIPIEDWKRIKDKYPDVDNLDNSDVPEWQKKMIIQRLRDIEKNPGSIKGNIEDLFKILDKKID